MTCTGPVFTSALKREAFRGGGQGQQQDGRCWSARFLPAARDAGSGRAPPAPASWRTSHARRGPTRKSLASGAALWKALSRRQRAVPGSRSGSSYNLGLVNEVEVLQPSPPSVRGVRGRGTLGRSRISPAAAKAPCCLGPAPGRCAAAPWPSLGRGGSISDRGSDAFSLQECCVQL